MIIIGITGGIGSGKSIVSELFALCDVPIYIADIESKRLTATSPIIRKKLSLLFGPELYRENELNKPLLASHIFNNKEKLAKVNNIIHPEVAKDFHKWVENNNTKPLLVKESAILFESGFDKFVNKTIMVYAPLNMRIERTMKRDNISREKVLDRIANQMDDEEKIKLSDYVIVNDGTQSLIKQVVYIIKQLTQ